MTPPEIIQRLVEKFREHKDIYHSSSYNEENVRVEFLNPFFEALGWDVRNDIGLAYAYRDVVHEEFLRLGDWGGSAPDYTFRIGDKRKFFVEAKKPSENLQTNRQHVYQLRRYGWSAKLPISILTDFEELAIYETATRPKEDDSPTSHRVLYISFEEYLTRWDEIYNLFSREAVINGSLEKFAKERKLRRGTSTIDKEFLKEIEKWRNSLAVAIAASNSNITVKELNYSVQKIIDRIMFLRVCEDRGIEPYGQLQALQNGNDVYKRLLELFYKADAKYNSGLFHFRTVRGDTESPDKLTTELNLPDMELKEIFKSLYYPVSPFVFEALPQEILGQVYEQFLGKVIRLDGDNAVIEEKPEVRKAGGVYYTPSYIIEYIVEQTVGKLVAGKTPKQVEKLRIVDPACGSGSFLLGAYTYLLNWHRDWYMQNDPAKHSRGRNPTIYQPGNDDWRLTLAEKKKILLNNIYGVDIDFQAIEVTKLTLLLKLLEGEIQQYGLETGILPSLGNNIKCGNSLIGTDYFTGQENFLESGEAEKVNPFDWEREFSEVFSQGGFDAVIGNPPYVRQESLGTAKEYFEKKYEVYHGVADLYAYFIEKGIKILNKGGYFSYIVANKWFRTNYAKPLREYLSKKDVKQIIDFGDLPVFENATTYTCILVVRNTSPGKMLDVAIVKSLDFIDVKNHLEDKIYHVKSASLGIEGWTLQRQDRTEVLEKIKQAGVTLERYVEGRVYYGIKTALNEAFVIDEETKEKLIADDSRSKELIKRFLIGKGIKKYISPDSNKYLIKIPKGWTNSNSGEANDKWKWFSSNYPSVAKHLLKFKEKAEKRWDKGDYWWELRACEYYDEFEKPKLIYPNICKRPEFTFDQNSYYTNQKCFIIPLDDKYLLGVLNSSVGFFLFQELLPKLRGGFYEPSYVYFKNFPIPEKVLHEESAKNLEKFVDTMLPLHRSLTNATTEHDRTIFSRQIEATDREIDKIVYELYGLSEDEIRIVEGQ